jgi:hypothetical protein
LAARALGKPGRVGDVDDRVRALARRGLEPRDIAEELGMPEPQVRAVLDQAGDRYDDADADSFPASDPPTSPAQ